MLDAAREAVTFAQGRTRSDLQADRILALALWKLLEIVGEAAYELSKEKQAEFPQLPWADIEGMRHRLVHGYYNLNWDVIWNTIANDLPPLITALETGLSSPDKQEGTNQS